MGLFRHQPIAPDDQPCCTQPVDPGWPERQLLVAIYHRLGHSIENQEATMALIDDVLAAQAAEDQDIAAADARVVASITDLENQLAAAIAAGGATPAQLQTILDSVNSERAALAGIDAAPVPPVVS